jgi:hypothetical protein
MYDHNHGKPCEVCCPHTEWWDLSPEYYGYKKDADNACCKLGCGMMRRDLEFILEQEKGEL